MMIGDRFHGSGEALVLAAEVVDKVCFNGGLHLYDRYLRTKDNGHCAQRLVQFFEEGVQVKIYSHRSAVLVFPWGPRRGGVRRDVEPRHRACNLPSVIIM